MIKHGGWWGKSKGRRVQESKSPRVQESKVKRSKHKDYRRGRREAQRTQRKHREKQIPRPAPTCRGGTSFDYAPPSGASLRTSGMTVVVRGAGVGRGEGEKCVYNALLTHSHAFWKASGTAFVGLKGVSPQRTQSNHRERQNPPQRRIGRRGKHRGKQVPRLRPTLSEKGWASLGMTTKTERAGRNNLRCSRPLDFRVSSFAFRL